MHISRRARTLSLATVAGSVPLLLALSLHGQPAPPPPMPPAETPRQVAEALDKIVQPRFQDVTAGQFGMTRLAPVVRGHQAIGAFDNFQTHTPAEAALLASADAPHRPYMLCFLHCAHIPGKPTEANAFFGSFPGGQGAPGASPSSVTRTYLATMIYKTFKSEANDPKMRSQVTAEREANEPLIQKVATDVLPGLLKGKAQEKTVGDWLVVMRPVRASKDSCLSCHTGAKRGDTLGVMVYAVGNPADKS